MALQSSGPISFGDLNDELGNSTTSQLDLKTASDDLSVSGAPYGMDELYGASGPGGTNPVSLGSDVTSAGACSAGTSTYYVPSGETFSTATALYGDAAGTINATAAWYSDGSIAREWNGSSFIGSSILCGL